MAGQSALILVTRPQPQADDWACQLNACGLSAQALPLIDIVPPADLAAVHSAWRALSGYRLVILVSPNAAESFIHFRPTHATWPPSTWAAAPGPGTGEALRQHLRQAQLPPPTLVCPPPDSPQFDSEHLWPELSRLDWHQQKVLIVSGGQGGQAQGRTWLTAQLQAAGASVDTVVAYGRHPATWQEAQHQLATLAYKTPQAHQWLFSSSEAIAYLLDRLGPPPAHARAIATHPRIAATARLGGFSEVLETAPRLQDLVMTLTPTVAPTPRP